MVHLFWAVRWSMEAAARGPHPERTHGGKGFEAGSPRAALAGQQMPARFALLALKGDWSEYCSTLGFPMWSSTQNPCIWCTCKQADMFKTTGFSRGRFPYPFKNMASYEAAVAACEVEVTIRTAEERDALKTALFFDKRRNGGRGRCMRYDLPSLCLRRGDRLEPCAALRDTRLLEEAPLPATLLFWRTTCETAAKRRMPLLAEHLGATLDIMVVDQMHVMHLGILQKYISFVLWSLLLRNAWKVNATSQDMRLTLGVQRLRAELFGWYPTFRRDWPGEEKCTEVSDFSLKHLGPEGAFQLKTKAAMTRPLLPFCVLLLRKYEDVLPQQAGLRAAGEALDSFLVLMEAERVLVSPGGIQEAHDLAKRAIKFWLAARVPTIPKLHAFMHLVGRLLAYLFA